MKYLVLIIGLVATLSGCGSEKNMEPQELVNLREQMKFTARQLAEMNQRVLEGEMDLEDYRAQAHASYNFERKAMTVAAELKERRESLQRTRSDMGLGAVDSQPNFGINPERLENKIARQAGKNSSILSSAFRRAAVYHINQDGSKTFHHMDGTKTTVDKDGEIRYVELGSSVESALDLR